MLRKLIGALVGLAMMGMVGTLGFVSTASASPISFDLDFTTTSGPAIDITGSFAIDGNDFTGIGVETFSPSGALTLLSLEVVVDPDGGGPMTGIVYMASDDIFFPALPTATFEDGVLQEIDFAAIIGGNEILIGLGPTMTGELDWIYRPATGTETSGTYSASAAIPEPATIALFGVGLAGLGLFGWHMKRRERGPVGTRCIPA